ncbi:MAG: hypothetical protein NT161_03610 [Candidatus Nomurabacteria bacterium]|nr:hypothetical protein [Candidatus Nomurabacteria bacterium]
MENTNLNKKLETVSHVNKKNNSIESAIENMDQKQRESDLYIGLPKLARKYNLYSRIDKYVIGHERSLGFYKIFPLGANAIKSVLKDKNYPHYYNELQSVLKNKFGDYITVKRISGYQSDGSGVNLKNEEKIISVSFLSNWGKDNEKTQAYVIPTEDVVLGGAEWEYELLVRTKNIVNVTDQKKRTEIQQEDYKTLADFKKKFSPDDINTFPTKEYGFIPERVADVVYENYRIRKGPMVPLKPLGLIKKLGGFSTEELGYYRNWRQFASEIREDSEFKE